MPVGMRPIKTKLNSLFTKRKKRDIEAKMVLRSTLAIPNRYGLVGKGSKMLGLNPKSIHQCCEEKKIVHRHGRALNETTVKVIHDFYEKSATIIPDKKLVSTKTAKENMLLTQSICAVHKNSQEE